ncbi:UNVERIFIED_CONTAM: hypothetical protein Sradi_6183100 [Sesamum radiatum]|uniref:Reverse transcriptase domain-containing protein n=1 Tax=Sesamum radiatum TaxID=300843 RepID=A0AAW2K8V0_SESRA
MIRWIKDSERRWREDTKGIQEVLLEYYRGIFTNSQPWSHELDVVLNIVSPKVTDAMNESLLQPFIEQEVRNAIFNMSPLKSPSPDGKVSQFRPISLCNTIVKIASKCVVNGLKSILDSVISHAQSAFILGRLITDNVLIVFEVNHFIKNLTRGKKGSFALKLNMSKALPNYLLHEIEMMIADSSGKTRVNIVLIGLGGQSSASRGKEGQFSVKSAYQIELRNNEQLQPSASNRNAEDGNHQHRSNGITFGRVVHLLRGWTLVLHGLLGIVDESLETVMESKGLSLLGVVHHTRRVDEDYKCALQSL